MKKAPWIVVILLILLLDWAALHDILLGSEPDYVQEWTWLVLSTLFLVGVAWLAVRRARASDPDRIHE